MTASRSLPRLVTARAILADAGRWIEGGALLLHDGRIADVLTRDAARRLGIPPERTRVLEDQLLTAGMVNAHAHFELTGMHRRLAGDAHAATDATMACASRADERTEARAMHSGSFSDWVRGVLRERAQSSPSQWPADWARGAARAVATGTTLAGDVDSTGAWAEARGTERPRVRVYRELLDAFDPARTPAAIARLSAPWPRRARAWGALSPHAPHTTSDALLDEIARRARGRAFLGVHWSETREETDWLEEGRGPFAAMLGPSPRTSGLDRLEARGLVGPRTALYHGNLARTGELDRVARAGATVVHCPGAHAWFDRAPVDVGAWLARGVRVALGTDSLAGNDDLDLARELAIARRASSATGSLAPDVLWELATRCGARALGFERRAGELSPGAWADVVAWRIPRFEHAAALDALTSGSARVAAVWIGGEVVHDAESGASDDPVPW